MRDTNARERRKGEAEYQAQAVRRATLARIGTLSRTQCIILINFGNQLPFDFADGSMTGLQREVLSLFEKGLINAQDIEGVKREDLRV